MNIDKAKLKALAEAAKAAAEDVIRSHGWKGMVEDADLLGTDERYLALADPATILALVAEIEELHESATFRAVQSLRADCEALRKDAERYQWLIRRISKSQYYFLGAQLTSNTLEGVGAAVDAAMAQEVQP